MSRTAILHLDAGADLPFGLPFEQRLHKQPGVVNIDFAQAESVLAITFDQAELSLGDLVRTVEDCGRRVLAVAQRPDQAALGI